MIVVEKPCVKLKACRANANMSQAAFADALGVDPSTVYNWEQERSYPAMPLLLKISEISGIPLNLIFIPDKS